MDEARKTAPRWGLRFKFAVLLATVLVAVMVAGAFLQGGLQRAQVEREMLQTAEVLASEMGAVWDFMEHNQNQFVTNEDGTYNLYCVVAAKAISRAFTQNTEGFSIRYTNTHTRRASDAADEFELEALGVFSQSHDATRHYRLTDLNGASVFRYAEPLFYTESCMECHGDPAGELDPMGYEKEGKQVGDLAGIASIVMPARTYEEGIAASTVAQTVVMIAALVLGMAVMFYAVSRLVLRPARRLEAMAQSIEDRDFAVSAEGVGDRDEMSELARHFARMGRELKVLYDDLESQVDERTDQLRRANAILRAQGRELEAMNVRLVEENRYKSEFLNIVSHEIRTPLTSILAFAEIWDANGNEHRPEDQAIVDEIRVSSQILLGMVENILGMARAEAGRLEIRSEPVDVAELLAEVRGATLLQARRQQVCLLTRSVGAPVVVSDGEKLRHIMVNLVVNALKFSPPGSEVEAAVRVESLGASRAQEGLLVIEVRDEGCGIAEADLPHVFDRFSRGDADGRDKPGGSGLGLALVCEFAELMGGEVSVESTKGRGSLFTVHVAVSIPSAEVDEW